MNILIKGMEMPTGCISCDFCNPFVEEPYCRRLMKRVPKVTRLDNCPLVEVPPHGRLIDANALYRTIDAASERTIGHTTFKETVLLDIRGMPTILESTMGQVNSEKAINEAEREE